MPKTSRNKKRKRDDADEKTGQPTALGPRRAPASHAPTIGTHMLLIFIGEPGQLITLHTDLLPAETERYIENRCQGQPAYQFPEEDLATMALYRSFLYTGRVFTIGHAGDQDHADDGKADMHADAEWTRLAHAHMLGSKLCDERFANACIDAIVEKVVETDRYPTGLANETYEYTQPSDRLRSLIIDLHVWKGLGTGLRPPHEDADGPKEFLQDVLAGLTEAGMGIHDAETKMPWEADICGRYHKHVVTSACK